MLTDFMSSIETLNRYGVPYRIFINSNNQIVIRYNEYDTDYTDEVYNSVGDLIQTVETFKGGEM